MEGGQWFSAGGTRESRGQAIVGPCERTNFRTLESSKHQGSGGQGVGRALERWGVLSPQLSKAEAWAAPFGGRLGASDALRLSDPFVSSLNRRAGLGGVLGVCSKTRRASGLTGDTLKRLWCQVRGVLWASTG